MASTHPRRAALTSSAITAALLAAAGLLAACGSDTTSSDTTSSDTTSADTDTTVGASSTGATVTSTATSPPVPSSGAGSSNPSASASTSTSAPAFIDQPAIFPAVGVVYDTPERAAQAFVTEVLQVPVSLGEYQGGDGRSGEIELRFRGDGSPGPAVVRSLLLLRQLGPDGNWFVLGAVNENASITSPAQGDAVPAGPLTVTGKARGFEGAVNVTATVAGHPDRVLGRAQAVAGSQETAEPFTVTLDLSAASPGSTVMLLVQGGVGNDDDPGETGAIALTIASR